MEEASDGYVYIPLGLPLRSPAIVLLEFVTPTPSVIVLASWPLDCSVVCLQPLAWSFPVFFSVDGFESPIEDPKDWSFPGRFVKVAGGTSAAVPLFFLAFFLLGSAKLIAPLLDDMLGGKGRFCGLVVKLELLGGTIFPEPGSFGREGRCLIGSSRSSVRGSLPLACNFCRK